MATTTQRRPSVAAVDDRAAGEATVGGDDIRAYVDEESLTSETEKLSRQNRVESRPFRQYQKKVINKAGVPNTHQTRQLTSVICGAIARLPFVPDQETKITDEAGHETTEFEQQVSRTAAQAEASLNSEAVWTVSARKLARAALELRAQDPDGSKNIAWVNDTLEDQAHVLDD